MYAVNFSDIQLAASRIESIIARTPVVNSPEIDKRAGRTVYMKCENLQHIGAFKFRGATNAVQLLGQEAEDGICTHSSGNHGQAVALAAKQRGVPSYIVMPENAPRIKVEGVASHGAEVILCEPNLAARISTAKSVLDRTGAAFIHPFDNPNVIAGQGTAAMEMIEECGSLDAILSPIGGGGLMSGTSISTKALLPSDAARSLEAGSFLPQTGPNTICDGLLTSMGELTWPIIRDHVERIVRVPDEEVLEAMTLIYNTFGMVVEPSGAISLAAVLRKEFKNLSGIKTIGIILCGGNVDPEKLPF